MYASHKDVHKVPLPVKWQPGQCCGSHNTAGGMFYASQELPDRQLNWGLEWPALILIEHILKICVSLTMNSNKEK